MAKRSKQAKDNCILAKIATRYANEPTVGGYDILNEPNWGFEDTVRDRNGLKEQKNGPLKQLMKDITQAIREVDKKHIIIIEGNGWGNNYQGVLGPWDDNMVLSFHKYWNHNDQPSIQHILDYRSQYNIPVWLGETGENSNTWFTEAIRLLEKNNIGWSWWPLKKLGNNNPLQIPSNPGYDSLVNYWNGKTNRPPAKNIAYTALMELAAHTKCEMNIVHRDVVDAMMRQPFSDESKPFRENKISNGTTLAAVDYDLGVNGKAYYDLDTANYYISTGKESMGNRGRMYRNDGVDIYEDSLHKGKYYVGHIEDGEWLQYTMDVLTAGKYDLVFTIDPKNSEGLFSVTDDGIPLAANVPVPAGGETTSGENRTLKNIQLKAGIQRLRIYTERGGYHFVQIQFYYRGT